MNYQLMNVSSLLKCNPSICQIDNIYIFYKIHTLFKYLLKKIDKEKAA